MILMVLFEFIRVCAGLAMNNPYPNQCFHLIFIFDSACPFQGGHLASAFMEVIPPVIGGRANWFPGASARQCFLNYQIIAFGVVRFVMLISRP